MSNYPELAWIAEARKHIGLKENTSKFAHSPTILSWLKKLGAWWMEDETPWCGTFVAHCLQTAGVKFPKNWFRALAYLNGGNKLAKPAYGCVAVKTRVGGGHVSLCLSVTRCRRRGRPLRCRRRSRAAQWCRRRGWTPPRPRSCP